ncbi:hypothetical protein E2C01_088325 [Portunus trituberculatus]|uniref:Uncharacterized protein n=1 Tax=Portunus trituberculatus TaxID=210409 RepID=A0A5B7JAF9_PORTR|nr:hypothetical protein [Portunus trituberculatus]
MLLLRIVLAHSGASDEEQVSAVSQRSRLNLCIHLGAFRFPAAFTSKHSRGWEMRVGCGHFMAINTP